MFKNVDMDIDCYLFGMIFNIISLLIRVEMDCFSI